MSSIAAEFVVGQLKKKPNSVLGLATGSTPLGMYQQLIELYKKGTISFKKTTTFNLDEYIGLPRHHLQTYHMYMKNHFFSKIDIPLNQTYIPECKGFFNPEINPCLEECIEYDLMIEKSGGIDLQILGIGSNGHIGFNEPAKTLETGTHIVALTEETRQANSRFFSSIKDVPTHAITMGVGTILKSKEIILLANGENKAKVITELFSKKVNPFIPATFLQVHPNVTVIIDFDASSYLDNLHI